MIRRIIIGLISLSLLVTNTYGGTRVVRLNNFVVKQKIVNLGFPVQIVGVPVTNLGPEYYYRIFRQSDEGISEEDVERIADAVVINLIKTLKLDEPTTPLPEDPNTPDNPGVEPPPDEPEAPPVPVNPNAEISRKVFNIVSTKCAQCHSGDNIKGNLEAIKDGKLNITDRAVKWDMADAVYSGTMPKNGPPLSQEDADLFKEWARIK